MMYSNYFFGQSKLTASVKTFIDKAQLNEKENGSLYILKVEAPSWAPKNCKSAFVAIYVPDAEHDSFVDYLREGKIEANGRTFNNASMWAVYDSKSKKIKNGQVRLDSDKKELRRLFVAQTSCDPFGPHEYVDMVSTYSASVAGAYLKNNEANKN